MNEQMKFNCLDFAIKSGAGTSYDEAGQLIVDADKIVAAAKLFEAYYAEKETK